MARMLQQEKQAQKPSVFLILLLLSFAQYSFGFIITQKQQQQQQQQTYQRQCDWNLQNRIWQNSHNNNNNKNSQYRQAYFSSLSLSSTLDDQELESSNDNSSNKNNNKKNNDSSSPSSSLVYQNNDNEERRINLMWCDREYCTDVVRERVVGDHNQIVFNGPATGQVAYRWNKKTSSTTKSRQINGSSSSSKEKATTSSSNKKNNINNNGTFRSPVTHASVLLLVKPQDESLIEQAAKAVPKMTNAGIQVLLFPELAAKLKYNYGVEDDDQRINLFEPPKEPSSRKRDKHVDDDEEAWVKEIQFTQFPDLICTLGGDGLLMFASKLFQGPVPPIISIAGGSLGFLTPFSVDEMVDALQTALGIENEYHDEEKEGQQYYNGTIVEPDLEVFPPNMAFPIYDPSSSSSSSSSSPQGPEYLKNKSIPKFLFGMGDLICMTIRMRLDCRVVNPEGIVRARYNVLNELVIDRGSSPYLSALECYCDDQHLTTVQADGIIFATPTGSTAYSMSAGGSVVHPAVPCILVTPICPHVLSFRSMVFPDHVILRCYVPDDARSHASVAFDGKHRSELQRGDSVQIQMSSYPVPTINRGDHSSDWLDSLKRSFNFNTRPRQRPL